MKNCLNCNKTTSNPKFCSRSCSASFNNSKNPKRKLKDDCSKCGNPIGRTNWKDRRRVCDNCNPSYIDWTQVTLKSIQHRRSYQVNSQIRERARKKYLSSDRDQKCFNCRYDRHFHVCHIKAISDHNEDAFVSEINQHNNLVALCPNCHWEYDNGILHLVFPDFEKLHS